jgi:RNA polymerase sigma factor (TIGR02999 family)
MHPSKPTHPASSPGDARAITNLLLKWSEGDRAALENLTPIIYDDLLRLARARLSRERGSHTLEATALVHESYLRLADQTRLQAVNRAHFYAIAANLMRRVLVDYARRRNADKRGAGERLTLRTGMDVAQEPDPDSLNLDEALLKLEGLDARKARVIELKYYGGMTAEEIALVMGISVATVGRELRLAQAWLRRELSHPQPSESP